MVPNTAGRFVLPVSFQEEKARPSAPSAYKAAGRKRPVPRQCDRRTVMARNRPPTVRYRLPASAPSAAWNATALPSANRPQGIPRPRHRSVSVVVEADGADGCHATSAVFARSDRSEASVVTPDDSYQLLPPLSPSQYEALKADIAEHGVLVPVELDETGAVLDGHHRLRAYRELRAAGVWVPQYPRVLRHLGSEEAKVAHALRLNLSRRHLGRAERAEVVAGLRQRTRAPGVHGSPASAPLGRIVPVSPLTAIWPTGVSVPIGDRLWPTIRRSPGSGRMASAGVGILPGRGRVRRWHPAPTGRRCGPIWPVLGPDRQGWGRRPAGRRWPQ